MTTRIHRAWWVAAVTFLVLIAAAAFRSTMGLMLEPLEMTFGWSRSTTSAATAVNLVFYGLSAPLSAVLLERFAIRYVVYFALLLVAAGTGLTIFMTQPWQLIALWGVMVGTGTGALALVFGATMANRWFVKNRGLITGIFSAAYATGSLVFLPLLGWLISHYTWRYASACVAGFAVFASIPALLVLRNRPSDVGALPYGATGNEHPTEAAPRTVRGIFGALTEVLPHRGFWVLAGTFFVCGWSTNGLIGTHFVSAAHDHGMPMGVAASLLAFVGIFDLIGTIGSGWLTDRVSSAWLLFMYYGLRGLALFSAPLVLGPTVEPPLLFFVVFYGLDWIATVPPTVQLCREFFGLGKSAVVYGWVFASHMIGAAVASWYGGVVRQVTGSYTIAWLTAAVLCIVAALSTLTLHKMRRELAFA